MSQNISVHSTDDSGTNIIPGIDDGGAGVGNGSTYQIFRNNAVTNSGNQIYYGKDKDGVIEPIAGGSGGAILNFQATATDDITTSSTTDVVATGMTLTPTSGTYLVWFSGSVEFQSMGNNQGLIFMSIYSNNSQIASSEERANTLNTSTRTGLNLPFNCVAKVTVDGTQDIEGRWRTDSSDNSPVMHQRVLTALKVA